MIIHVLDDPKVAKEFQIVSVGLDSSTSIKVHAL